MVSIKKIEKTIVNNYFVILFLSYALNFFISFRPAVFLIFINLLLLLIRTFYINIKVRCIPIYLFCFYLFISLIISIVNNSVEQAFNSYLYIFTPCVLFFSLDNDEVEIDYLLISFVIASFLNEIIGLSCFYTKPDFFVDFLLRTNLPAYEQLMHHAGYGRMVTMFGSIETAQFAAITIIVCIGFIYYRSKFKPFCIIALVLSGVVLVLTQQRGPLFALAIGMVYLFVRYRGRIIRPRLLVLFSVILLFVMHVLYLYLPTVFEWILERISNPSAAIESRYDYQWDVLTDNLYLFEWLIGKGIGSFGFFVNVSTIHTRIFDQMYFNIIGEEGILGLIIFIAIVIKCFSFFLQKPKVLFVPAFIIFEIVFTGLGTTLIYYPPIMPLFWVSVGMIMYQHYFKDSLMNERFLLQKDI